MSRSLNTLKVEFTGRLRIYHVPHIQKRMVFAGDILYPDYVKKIDITSPPLWDNYIAEDGLKEEWIITFNKKSGNFEIKPGVGWQAEPRYRYNLHRTPWTLIY